jgi:hypothetical protein
VADELRVDAALAYSPRDQLRVLPTEIEDENGPVLAGRKRYDPGLLNADSSAPPL